MRTQATGSVLALLLLASVPRAATAQFAGGDQDNGTYSLTILGIPISPRAIGLGEAMATIDRDPTAMWYNAAGLAGLRTNALTVTASQRFAQTQLVGAAVSLPTEIATFGVAARVLNEGVIEGRLENELDGGNIRGYQYVLEGGGALQLARFWRWGGSLYFAQQTEGDDTYASVGINSGMQLNDILFERLSIGFGVRNIGLATESERSGDIDQDSIVINDASDNRFPPPLLGYAGAGFDLLRRRNLLQTPMLFRGSPIIVDAKLVGQLFVPRKRELYFGLGIEGTVNGVAIGRIGYQTGDDNRKGLSLGAGVNVGQFRLEYAFRDHKNAGAKFLSNDPVGDAHNVSFSYFWGERERNEPVTPLVVSTPLDTSALGRAVRDAVRAQLDSLRPLLDSLRRDSVIIERGDLTARYIVPVHFGFDSAVVRDTDYVVLGQVAEVIRQVYPNALVTIEGFADPAGTIEYNRRLSQRRADAVKEVMVTRFGLPSAQFKTVGYGKQRARLVTPGAARDDPGAEGNRRVAFTIDATRSF